MDKLFAYGTLVNPEVVKQVVGRALPMREAVLHGYERVRHPRLFYASVQPNPNAKVEGQLIEGIDDAAWQALDEYEGPYYERKLVPVDVGDISREMVEAFVYVHTQQDTPITTAKEEDYRDVHPTERVAWRVLKVTCLALVVFVLISGIVAGVDFVRFGGGAVYYDAARVIRRDDRSFTLRITHLDQTYEATMSLRAYRRRYGRLYPYVNQLAKVRYQVGRDGRSVKLLDVELIWPGGGGNE
ncbi:MAG: gamma-glutamylcyclotransferase [Abditibacteriales bacterium]|nr:gamma-glutamylcyclotransferase [Abditibacteriales bacterium]MDW8367212.1 gamma-glutamylcyclotransferase family protein [Abditibacteriales bacterium]